jgi:hypothetical protein
MRLRSLGTILAVAVALGVAVPVAGEAPRAAASACGMSFHAQGFLTNFPPFAGSLFYSGREGSAATATIRVTPGCSDSPPGIESVRVQFVTEPGTASSDVDYAENDYQTGLLCDDVHGQCAAQGESPNFQENVALQTLGDVDIEPLESFRLRLTGATPNPTPPGFREPSNVPVYVIDVNGASRASLEPGVAYSRSETFVNILIPVFLAGPSPSGSVTYTLTPGPGAPATPGQDYQDLTGGSVSTANGVGYIDIGIVNDKIGEGPESVTIMLGGTVDGPASTTFTILDNEESEPPTSRFHHPRHTWRYKKSDYRIREFHVFTTDNEGGSGVVASEIALRRNRKNGTCSWLTLSGWHQKDCQNREWLPTTYDEVGELFYHRMKQLKSSVGTRIKDYTAFSRAIDGAENIENEFTQRRNANTFEIKRSRRRR